MIQEPVPVGVRRDVRPLEWVGAQVVHLHQPQFREGLGPDLQRAWRTLLLEHELPVLVAKSDQIAVVVEVDELLPRAVRLLAREIWKLVVAIGADVRLADIAAEDNKNVRLAARSL